MVTTAHRLVTVNLPLFGVSRDPYEPVDSGDGILMEHGKVFRFRNFLSGWPAIPLAGWWFHAPDSRAHQQIFSDLLEKVAALPSRTIDLGSPVLVDGQVLLPITTPDAVTDLRDTIADILDRHPLLVHDWAVAETPVGWLGYQPSHEDVETVPQRIPGWQRHSIDGLVETTVDPVRELEVDCLEILDQIDETQPPLGIVHLAEFPLGDPPPTDQQPRSTELGGRTLQVHTNHARVPILCRLCHEDTHLTLHEIDLYVWLTCRHRHYIRDQRVTAYVADQARQQLHTTLDDGAIEALATPDTTPFFLW
jgi:hypothetical protein